MALNYLEAMDNADLLALFQDLQPFQKPHPGIAYVNAVLKTSNSRALVQQRMRIQGSVTTRADFMQKDGGYWNETLFGLAAEIGVTDVSMYFVHPAERKRFTGNDLSNWQIFWQAEIDKMYNDMAATTEYAESFGLRIGYVITGQEAISSKRDDDIWNTHLDDFYDEVYRNIQLSTHCDEIIYYSRLNRVPNQGKDGWAIRKNYTGRERNKYLCCDCYYPDDPMLIREQMHRMAELARDRRLGEPIVPWTCLGRGTAWKFPIPGYANETAKFSLNVHHPETWWYVGRWFNWENQAWVNGHGGMPLFQRTQYHIDNGWYDGTARVLAGDIPFIIMWPGLFDHRANPYYGLTDFIAYHCGSFAEVPTSKLQIVEHICYGNDSPGFPYPSPFGTKPSITIRGDIPDIGNLG